MYSYLNIQHFTIGLRIVHDSKFSTYESEFFKTAGGRTGMPSCVRRHLHTPQGLFPQIPVRGFALGESERQRMRIVALNNRDVAGDTEYALPGE